MSLNTIHMSYKIQFTIVIFWEKCRTKNNVVQKGYVLLTLILNRILNTVLAYCASTPGNRNKYKDYKYCEKFIFNKQLIVDRIGS